MDHSRDSLNNIISFGDFIPCVARELLAYADKLQQEDERDPADTSASGSCNPTVSESEIARLRKFASDRKHYRIAFFNSGDSITLLFEVLGHEMQ